MKKLNNRFPLLKYIIPIVLLGAGAWLMQRSPELTPESQLARQTQAQLLGLKPNAGPEAYEAGESPEQEGEFLLSLGDFWALRVSYPTGNYQQSWLQEAAEQDARIKSALPEGTQKNIIRHSLNGGSNLDPSQFTSLGPQPLQSDGCQNCFNYGIVAGRTNVIASDPVSTNIAYIGSDGGGVWKTENCCDANTSWRTTTDDPTISSIAIGDLTLDPNDRSVVYAGTGDLRYGSWSFGSAGLLKSTDFGETWEVKGADVFAAPYTYTIPVSPAVAFPQYQSIGKVRVDPRNSNNVVVTTKTGVYFSYDAAENWTGPCYTNSYSDQRQDGTGLILYDNGVETEIYVAIGTRGQATPVQPDLDFKGANGIYHTTMPASGCPATWTTLTTGANGWPAGTADGDPTNDNVGRIDLAMAPSDPDTIYAQVANSTLSLGLLAIYRTTDGGATWEQRAVGADLIACDGSSGNYTQNWYDQGVAVDPSDPDTVFKNNVDLWRSTDGGASFTNLTCGYTGGEEVHVDHHGLAYVGGSSNILMNSNDGGVYVTTNADEVDPNNISFTQMNDTLNTIEFYSGDITGNFNFSDSPGINGGAQDNGSMVAVWDVGGGETVEAKQWQVTTGGDGMYARIEPKEGNIWFQESQNGNLKRSTTGPFGTYSVVPAPFSGDTLSFIMPYELDKYNCPDTVCNHMIIGTNRVWESINVDTPTVSNILYYPNSPNLTKGVLGNRSFIAQLSYAVSNGSIAVAGTLDGNVQYGFDLGQGVADSATWVDVTDGNAVLPNRPIMDVATDPVVPTTAYAAIGGFDQNTPTTPGHVYQVTCNADCSSFTWADKSGNLPNIPANSIIVNPNIPAQVFVGTDWGLYYTDDVTEATPTWNLLDAGLPRVMIWDMSIDRGFTTLAVFTRSRGAYVWPLPIEADFRLSVDPVAQAACVPDSVNYTIDIAQLAGFSQDVDLAAVGVPTGYSASFDTNPVTPPGQSVMTLANTGAATTGAYSVDIVGSTLTRTITSTVGLDILNNTPDAVTLVAPADGAANVPFEPTFEWDAGGFGTSGYLLEVATDGAFANVVYSNTVLNPSDTMPLGILSDATTYYWRVRATNMCGLGTASEIRSFSTVDLTGACPAGLVADVAYEYDFEAGEAGWTHEGIDFGAGVVDFWMLTDTNASSGAMSWYAQDHSARSDQRLTSPEFTLGDDPVLRFENLQLFETPDPAGCWDAGVLEITTDGGTTWQYVDNSHMLSDSYDQEIWDDTFDNNPLTVDYGFAPEAWCDPAGSGFFPALVDLSDWAGETVQLRWRLATDNFVGAEGWYIDDVRVQSCVAPMYDVAVATDVTTSTTDIGATATYNVVVTNNGNGVDSFAIDVMSNWDATASVTNTGILEAGESFTVTVDVTVPMTATEGAMDTATVTVTSDSDGTVTGSVDVTTVANISTTYIYLPVIMKN